MNTPPYNELYPNEKFMKNRDRQDCKLGTVCQSVLVRLGG
jgi:hypothetical protein